MNSNESGKLLNPPAAGRGNQVDITMKSIQEFCVKKNIDFLNGISSYRASERQKKSKLKPRENQPAFLN